MPAQTHLCMQKADGDGYLNKTMPLTMALTIASQTPLTMTMQQNIHIQDNAAKLYQ